MPEATWGKVVSLIIEQVRTTNCNKNVGGFCTAYNTTCTDALANMTDWQFNTTFQDKPQYMF
jgi:uncharacterized protein YecT (DUF1311 family)